MGKIHRELEVLEMLKYILQIWESFNELTWLDTAEKQNVSEACRQVNWNDPKLNKGREGGVKAMESEFCKAIATVVEYCTCN